MDDDRRRRQIEQDDGEQPEDDVGRPELRGHAHPAEADDVQHLREHQVADAEGFVKVAAVRGGARGGGGMVGGGVGHQRADPITWGSPDRC